ncbi:MAG: anhydro-N-acetylmuramic acid kinase [Betaproteobacteria bacterium]
MAGVPQLFAGVMSGTSLDGVDAVVADFAPPDNALCTLRGCAHVGFAPNLRTELLALQTSGPDELVRAARSANALADVYAQAIGMACRDAAIDARAAIAVGVHGQTVRHRPAEGWTWQINNPSRVAELSGITVVADFRSRDIAAGGHGAPLVPAFHAALFGTTDRHRVIVNLGGIANITDLPLQGPVRGFDTGPGNVLLDDWCSRHLGTAFDADGAWAATGTVDPVALRALHAEPFLALPPPKSTGRDLFNPAWLDAHLAALPWRGTAPDMQATLTAFTARTVAAAIKMHAGNAVEVFVAGGGARNATLMRMLATLLPGKRVVTTDTLGVASDYVEALAFAWLAREALAGRPGNLPAVTGASGLRVLGGIYPR